MTGEHFIQRWTTRLRQEERSSSSDRKVCSFELMKSNQIFKNDIPVSQNKDVRRGATECVSFGKVVSWVWVVVFIFFKVLSSEHLCRLNEDLELHN